MMQQDVLLKDVRSAVAAKFRPAIHSQRRINLLEMEFCAAPRSMNVAQVG